MVDISADTIRDITLPTNDQEVVHDSNSQGPALILRDKRAFIMAKRVQSIRSKGFYNDHDLFKGTPSCINLIHKSLNLPYYYLC